MSVSRWHMNRIGLVDFWCYENEEFEFENGHMLLRGSNGSGKSVTMQSFIPLLLDGNKSSERLDPFGTRSRKMDTYLIDENSDRDERIGYLYLEFKRADSNVYKTIGMGLRARRGKPLQSWYFIIEDNRRINIDFSLIENHYTLTEKQLKNIIGEQLITSQREYMKKVNQALFGFESLDDYSDAISLLLQLRSPKLSNSLSPQKINEILGRSLQPLSDEELRPMSEAIINMDTLQDQLESLKQSLTAAKKLEQAYQTYNQAFLLEKWQKCSRETQKLSELEQLVIEKCAQKDKFVKKIKDYQQLLKKNQIETEVKNNELITLKNNNIDQWLLDIKKYEQDICEYNQELSKKHNNYEQKESSYLSSKQRIKQFQDNITNEERDCLNILKDMSYLNENLSLSEHIALQECFKQRQHNFEFSYTRQILNNEMKMIDNAIKKWNDFENKKANLDFFEQQQSEKQLKIEETNINIKDAQKIYKQEVEEYLEYFYQYNETNQVLKLSKDDLDNLRDYLIDYESTHDYLEIKNIIDNNYQSYLTTITNNSVTISNQATLVKEKITALTIEKDKWLNAKDLEPDRSLESAANRQYLEKCNIEYIPLYKLLDFAEDMNEDDKNRIEELLIQMNILDALIISHDNKKEVLLAPDGCQDHYLWTNKPLQTLNLVCFDESFNQKQLLEGLISLGIENTNHFYLEQRYFQSGIIEGSLSLNQRAVYIGYKRRLQKKQEMIDNLNNEINENQTLYDALTTKIAEYQKQLNILKKEHDDFIDEKPIKMKLNEVEKQQEILKNLELQLQEIINNLLIEKEKVTQIYQELQKTALQMKLPMQLSAFNERKKDLQDYQGNFEKYKDAYTKLLQNLELINLEHDKFEQLTNDLDELNYEIQLLNQKLETVEGKKDSLQKQFEEAGYSDLIQKITQVESRLNQLNQESQNLKDEITKTTKDIEYIENSLQDTSLEKTEQLKRTQIYQDILDEELNYKFIFKDKLSTKELNHKLKLLSQQFGVRKNIADYLNNLQTTYFEQTTYLSQYNVVQENIDLCREVEDISNRLVLKAINQGKKIAFLELLIVLQKNIEMQEMLIMEEDRLIFEEILVNTIGKKIRERIQASRRWVEKMQKYMNDMNTSSGLQLSLKWKSRKALDDQQLDTAKLVELLEKDYRILKETDRQKISNHFRSKIASARKMSLDENTTASFHQLMKEVMDYREWFDFTLFAKKPNENRKELTAHVFYAYSGGEKALSMYVPLFSAVAAKFEGARDDAPVLIALDEAFAGVDENNIDNMFALITKFDFDYIMNSQSLWGDYPSCRSLAIYELFRPNNAPFVTVVAYTWNGQSKRVKLT